MDEPIRFYECSPNATFADLINLYPEDFSFDPEESEILWLGCRLYVDSSADGNITKLAPDTKVEDVNCALDSGNVGAPIYFSLIQK